MTPHSLHPVRRSLLGGGRAQVRDPFAGDAWSHVDQVQELGPDGEGHTGCVNALSWSDDGSILLSGSDDKKVCIWTADTSNPPSGVQAAVVRMSPNTRISRGPSRFMSHDDDDDDDHELLGNTNREHDGDGDDVYDESIWPPNGYPLTTSPHPLKLKDTIVTGHRANIFSAKFLPHSNTPTIVTCAGDGDVRVFEVDRLTTQQVGRRGACLYGIDGPGVRVLRCHTDRTKRIATEGSPHLFLTVSEDGTVRQHDLRRPHQCRTECPDPLFRAPAGVDLYSLSMSPLAPHTFAVAGQTDVAYICDRRKPEHQTPGWGPHTMRATQVHCVRRLGLPEEEWAKVGNGRYGSEQHITCVKISADHPDEVICAFATHSTSLFSLNDTPVDRGAAAGKEGGIVPNNPKPKTTESSGASPILGAPKRRVSDRSSKSSTNLDERAHSRARTEGAGYSRENHTSSSPSAAFALVPTSVPDPDAFAVGLTAMFAKTRKRRRSRRQRQADPAAGEGSASRMDTDDDTVMRDEDDEPGSSDDDSEDELMVEDESGEELDLTDYLRRRDEASGINLPASDVDEDRDEEDDLEEEEDMDLEEEFRFVADATSDLDDFGDDDNDNDNDDDDHMGWSLRGARSSRGAFKSVDILHPRRIFLGARNVDTVKDCNFLGHSSDKVCSGSDDGNWFLWDKLTGRLEGLWKGDDDVVNVMEQHPTLPLVAVSGIDNTVKMFAPTPARPPVSMNRFPDAERIMRRNARQRSAMEPTMEASALQFLSQIIAARRAADPSLSGRQHLLQFLSTQEDRASGDAGAGGEAEGEQECRMQ